MKSSPKTPVANSTPDQYGRLIVQLAVVLFLVFDADAALSLENNNLKENGSSAGTEWFEKKIRPVLIEHCYQCHSALSKEVKGGLLLDTRDSLRKGGESGPAIVPGDLSGSLLMAAIRHESVEMPPGKKLSDQILSDFAHWIETGAADPRDEPADPALRVDRAKADQFAQLRNWWSLQPLTKPAAPEVRDLGWSDRDIDRFVLAALERNGLKPAKRASREVLARRLTFVLTGLPATPQEIDEFCGDSSDDAWSGLIERLLSSPHFGEHWARHWMDVVRYTDTYGYEWDMPAKGAWRYRDYLVRAFNADVPFNQLIREQLAGDLLASPRINADDQINESLIGPMFYQMGEKRHGDSAEFDGIHQEMLDNKIDAFSKAFQAQTIACARCHDHKLDSILQSEYYALGGVLMSSRWVTNTLDTPERNASALRHLREIKLQIQNQLASLWQNELQSLPKLLLSATTEPVATAGDAPQLPADAAAAVPPSKIWNSLLAAESAELPLEHPARPWQVLAIAARQAAQHTVPATTESQSVVNVTDIESDLISNAWQALRQQYSQERAARISQNQADFQVVADFRKETPAGWSVDGVGVRESVPCGDFAVSLTGSAIVGRLFPGGLLTSSLSPRLNGAIRTPWLNSFGKQFISFEQCGGEFSAHRSVVDNAFLTERQVYLKHPAAAWLQLSAFSEMPERHIYIELATKTSNPNFPPRVGLGGACSEEQVADPQSWLGLCRVVTHDKPGAPADELDGFLELFEAAIPPAAPRSLSQAAIIYSKWLQSAVTRWGSGHSTPSDVRLINWLLDHSQLSNRNDLQGTPELTELVAEYRRAETLVKTPQTINGMADVDSGFNLRLLNRGEYDQPAAEVPRGYLQELGCSAEGFSEKELTAGVRAIPGSGRLQLAELVASDRNPLTARVFVNRVWHWLFGAGIVRTPDDFGHVGDRPSHPELLDYLAAQFIKEQWSLKQLIRSIVLTETWQQSSYVGEVAVTLDPENRLLHHYPLRRLEAESIRDTILAVSGRLDRKLAGPPDNPYRQNEDPQKRLYCGPLDGNGRRSIYTKQTIMEPPRLLAIFNQPAPKIPAGKRDITSTPAQSLALLNDPFVFEQARFWARSMISADSETASRERLRAMFRRAFGRVPDDKELQRWMVLIEDVAVAHQVPEDQILSSEQVWTDVAHAFMNTKELIYVP